VSREPINILLVGESVRHSPQLVQWLESRGCTCRFAPSYRDACMAIGRIQFDLVLSQYDLPDRTAFPLLEWLAGSPATLLFSACVESGFLWLKMLERGERCVGFPAMRSSALIAALDHALTHAPSVNTSAAETLRPNVPLPLSRN
jgi:CheY-like chemotaxis protein